MTRKVLVLALVAVVAAGIGASSAWSAAPQILRFTIDETNPDEVLSDACGLPVDVRADGQITFKIGSFDGTGFAGMSTANIALTAMANGKTYRLPRSVGVDLLLVRPNGDVIDVTAGQQFELAGATIVDLTTDEILVSPRHSTSVSTEEICAALAP
jgi:hypothetical protein